MITLAATSSRARRTFEVSRDWLASGRRQAIVALLLYTAITIVYFGGLYVLPHLGSTCVCTGGGGDVSAYMWNQAWWPHALLHGMNPFYTTALFAPHRLILGGQAAMSPLAAILFSPITLLFGTVVSYNVWMLVSPPLAAFFTFLLCRYVSRNFAASLFGGYVFAFSPYMLLHGMAHANLVFIFMIPAAVHLTLRLIDGRISHRRFIVLMALALAGLAYTSTEPALTFVVLGAVALALAFVLVPSARPRLLAAAKPFLASGVLAVLLTAPVLYYAFKGNAAVPTTGNGDLYAGDALGFLVPSPLLRLGRNYFAALSTAFGGGAILSEGSVTYVGVPLALIAAMYVINRWRQPATRFLAAILAVVVVFILGSHLRIAGYPTIPLPWKLFEGTILGEALPSRLALYMFLIIAVIAALWLAQARTGRETVVKWALAAASIAFLVPNLSVAYWHGPVDNPPFFATNQYRTVLKPNDIVLALPYGPFGSSMFWQAETGMWFRMTSGYLGRKFPEDYLTDPLWPALLGEASPRPALVRSFIARRHVDAVILETGTSPHWNPTLVAQWTTTLAAIGLKPRSLGGILYFRT